MIKCAKLGGVPSHGASTARKASVFEYPVLFGRGEEPASLLLLVKASKEPVPMRRNQPLTRSGTGLKFVDI